MTQNYDDLLKRADIMLPFTEKTKVISAEQSLIGRMSAAIRQLQADNERLKGIMNFVEGDLFLLAQAISAGDEKRELKFRVDELIRALLNKEPKA